MLLIAKTKHEHRKETAQRLVIASIKAPTRYEKLERKSVFSLFQGSCMGQRAQTSISDKANNDTAHQESISLWHMHLAKWKSFNLLLRIFHINSFFTVYTMLYCDNICVKYLCVCVFFALYIATFAVENQHKGVLEAK